MGVTWQSSALHSPLLGSLGPDPKVQTGEGVPGSLSVPCRRPSGRGGVPLFGMLPHGPLAWAWRWQDPAGHAVQHYHWVLCPRHEPTVTSSDSKTPQNAPNMKSSRIPNPAAATWLMKSPNRHRQRRCELLNTTKHAFSWILGSCRQPSRR